MCVLLILKLRLKSPKRSIYLLFPRLIILVRLMAEGDYLNLLIQHQLGSIMRWLSKPNCSYLTMKPLFSKAGWNFIMGVHSLWGHDSVSEFVVVLEKWINTWFFSSASRWRNHPSLCGHVWLYLLSLAWDPWLHEKAVGITSFSAFEELSLRKTPIQTLHPCSFSRCKSPVSSNLPTFFSYLLRSTFLFTSPHESISTASLEW